MGKNEWRNEWSSAADTESLCTEVCSACSLFVILIDQKLLERNCHENFGSPVQRYYHQYYWCSSLVTTDIILCLHGTISHSFKSNHAMFFCVFRQRTLTGEWHQASVLSQHIRGQWVSVISAGTFFWKETVTQNSTFWWNSSSWVRKWLLHKKIH